MKLKFKKIILFIWLIILLFNIIFYFSNYYLFKGEENFQNLSLEEKNNKKENLILEKMSLNNSQNEILEIKNIDLEIKELELIEKNEEFERIITD